MCPTSTLNHTAGAAAVFSAAMAAICLFSGPESMAGSRVSPDPSSSTETFNLTSSSSHSVIIAEAASHSADAAPVATGSPRFNEAGGCASGPSLSDGASQRQLHADDPRRSAYDGYRLVFAEEFSADGKPDSTIWKYEEGFCRNHEDQYYNADRNIYIKDGVLVIEARDDSALGIPNPRYNPADGSWPSSLGPHIGWTSGSMMTKGTPDGGYSWLYGIYEVRAKAPRHLGCWPAIWSTGQKYEWPYGGETDIMEYYGGGIHGNVAWGNGGRYDAAWNSAFVPDSRLGEGWDDDYHIWRMIWEPEHIAFWCDDILVNDIPLDSTVNAPASGDFDHGDRVNPFREVRQNLWLNLALGGDNGGSLDDTPSPVRYLIDYARIYQKEGTDGAAALHIDPVVSEPRFNVPDGVEVCGSPDGE